MSLMLFTLISRLAPNFTNPNFNFSHLKFIYSEKATKFCKIFTLLLTVCTVAFSEYMNLTQSCKKVLGIQNQLSTSFIFRALRSPYICDQMSSMKVSQTYANKFCNETLFSIWRFKSLGFFEYLLWLLHGNLFC